MVAASASSAPVRSEDSNRRSRRRRLAVSREADRDMVMDLGFMCGTQSPFEKNAGHPRVDRSNPRGGVWRAPRPPRPHWRVRCQASCKCDYKKKSNRIRSCLPVAQLAFANEIFTVNSGVRSNPGKKPTAHRTNAIVVVEPPLFVRRRPGARSSS